MAIYQAQPSSDNEHKHVRRRPHGARRYRHSKLAREESDRARALQSGGSPSLSWAAQSKPHRRAGAYRPCSRLMSWLQGLRWAGPGGLCTQLSGPGLGCGQGGRPGSLTMTGNTGRVVAALRSWLKALLFQWSLSKTPGCRVCLIGKASWRNQP